MTDTPYTEADIELAAGAISAYDYKHHLSAGGEIGPHHRNEARAALAALAAAGRLATNGRCGDVAPSLSHLASRIRQTCRLTAGHAGWHRGDDGSEWVEHGQAAPAGACPCTCHQPDRCPCRPGTPKHHHGAGGYCTVGDPDQHVVAFAYDGTWTLEHPATCRAEHDAADAAEWDCPVRRLAERQVTSDLAALMAGGRYACSVGALRDVFQLDGRLHDDQCTTAVCAACGCWCHAEEQTED